MKTTSQALTCEPMVERHPDIDERPEQLRPPIIRSQGGTASERYLAKLADQSFLNLWSYPSPYRDGFVAQMADGIHLANPA